jgi:glucoamylase
MPEGYLDVQPSLKDSTLTAIADEMFQLMMRNVATAGIVYANPAAPSPPAQERLSLPGCVLASPSRPLDRNSGKQDYVHNWTRDAAIAMVEITAQGAAITDADVKQRLADYISFADICQRNAPKDEFSIACFRIDGQPRCDSDFQKCWSAQSDGPALQTLALLDSYKTLDAPVKATAREVIERNLQFLLSASDDNIPQGVPGYQATTFSPWEEEQGYSFFARAVQLRCLREIKDHTFGITVPAGLDDAIAWLEARLPEHWNGNYYTTFAPDKPPRPWTPNDPDRAPYDPNSDVLMACVYGAIAVTDPRLLATAAAIRTVYDNEDTGYPINQEDGKLGYGPLIGRYPGDYYDGDVTDSKDNKHHPWALTSCNLAEIYYRLATEIENAPPPPDDQMLALFYQQIGLPEKPDAGAAVEALRDAGDRILQAVVYHSDNLELSEQFDQATGFQKSVSNLTWSYAAFLSAVKARTAGAVRGQ